MNASVCVCALPVLVWYAFLYTRIFFFQQYLHLKSAKICVFCALSLPLFHFLTFLTCFLILYLGQRQSVIENVASAFRSLCFSSVCHSLSLSLSESLIYVMYVL